METQSQEIREMNADIFDVMEMSCDIIFEGLGIGRVYHRDIGFDNPIEPLPAPNCFIGHVNTVARISECITEWTYTNIPEVKEIIDEFKRLELTDSNGGFPSIYTDRKVDAVRAAFNSNRVSWKDFCSFYNIVRKPNPWEGTDSFGFSEEEKA
jgi:hypothetical protein